MKTVHKPWGKEIWLELNDKYCYKRIYINAGTKTVINIIKKKWKPIILLKAKLRFG